MHKLQEEGDKQQSIEFARQLAYYTYINCWHRRETESYGMWRVYGETGYSIAIQTTYDRLYQSLKHRGDIVLGVVDYKCYENEQLNPIGTAELIPYFNKSKFFEEEAELRAVIQRADELRRFIEGNGEYEQIALPNGILVEVDLDLLIEKIYLSPSTPGNYKSAVEVSIRKFGYQDLSSNVYQSALDGEPLYGPAI
jgi:hypothetical protein